MLCRKARGTKFFVSGHRCADTTFGHKMVCRKATQPGGAKNEKSKDTQTLCPGHTFLSQDTTFCPRTHFFILRTHTCLSNPWGGELGDTTAQRCVPKTAPQKFTFRGYLFFVSCERGSYHFATCLFMSARRPDTLSISGTQFQRGRRPCEIICKLISAASYPLLLSAQLCC